MEPGKTVLIVDDTATNVSLLNAILKPQFKTKIATSGAKALSLARAKPGPDLILLDIMMPEIDGYEVCKTLKSSAATRDIPIIFVTALGEVKDETKGLNLGAVDYITKPFSPPVVLARVRTHLDLSDTRKKLSDSLQKTLLGSVRILTDLLAVSNPEAFSRALRLKSIVHDLAGRLGTKDAWKYEVAASLSQLGCMFLPPELMYKINNHLALSESELALYRTYPQRSCELLSNIPHLEESAEIIRRLKLFESVELFDFHGDKVVGNALLQGAIYFDEQLGQGQEPDEIIESMRPHFPAPMMNSLQQINAEAKDDAPAEVALRDLGEGMVLAEDLISDTGSVIVPKGATLTDTIVRKLKSGWSERLHDLIKIRQTMKD
ncbi:response regulator [Marinobacterium mangrovicola]|uniref:Response regulator RpfG family c-di-GMP phosphodiesterase n=1 Tax=Marinobacterium mangrovicola TaxID=1476959 RepID=A0A4R1GQ33_9GAMM|nr:response regulator [Marinobacterium mangrovicola]TCK09115.1 response regulator RpfG family c-di-GMP phosphodiesterase [Marinobacterium mangrovicola]